MTGSSGKDGLGVRLIGPLPVGCRRLLAHALRPTAAIVYRLGRPALADHLLAVREWVWNPGLLSRDDAPPPDFSAAIDRCVAAASAGPPADKTAPADVPDLRDFLRAVRAVVDADGRPVEARLVAARALLARMEAAAMTAETDGLGTGAPLETVPDVLAAAVVAVLHDLGAAAPLSPRSIQRARAHHMLGRAHQRLGEPGRAAENFDAATRCGVGIPWAGFLAARLLARAGADERADAMLTRTIAMDLPIAEAHRLRGDLAARRSDPAAAADHYVAALETAAGGLEEFGYRAAPAGEWRAADTDASAPAESTPTGATLVAETAAARSADRARLPRPDGTAIAAVTRAPGGPDALYAASTAWMAACLAADLERAWPSTVDRAQDGPAPGEASATAEALLAAAAARAPFHPGIAFNRGMLALIGGDHASAAARFGVVGESVPGLARHAAWLAGLAETRNGRPRAAAYTGLRAWPRHGSGALEGLEHLLRPMLAAGGIAPALVLSDGLRAPVQPRAVATQRFPVAGPGRTIPVPVPLDPPLTGPGADAYTVLRAGPMLYAVPRALGPVTAEEIAPPPRSRGTRAAVEGMLSRMPWAFALCEGALARWAPGVRRRLLRRRIVTARSIADLAILIARPGRIGRFPFT